MEFHSLPRTAILSRPLAVSVPRLSAAAVRRPETLICLFAAALAALVATFWWRLLITPHMVEKVEVQVLSLVLWWRGGTLPYVEPWGLPLLQNPYGPLYQWLCTVLPASADQPYLMGRALSILAVTASLGLVYVAVRRQTGRISLALLAALLPLLAKPIILFAPLYRVDSLALFFSVLGFFLVTVPRQPRIALAMIAFILAFLTKMTHIAAPAACVIFLWQGSRPEGRRRALVLAGGLAVALALSVLALEVLTHGAYLANAAFGNLPTRPFKSLEMLVRPGISILWFLALGMAALERRFDPRSSPAFFYVMTSLVTAAAFGANPLSSWNYLMEVYVALGFLTGEILRRRHLATRAGALLALHIALSLPLATAWMDRTLEALPEYRQRYELAREILSERLDSAPRAAVYGSLAGRDAMNALNRQNAVSVPEALEQTSRLRTLIAMAYRRGLLDVVVEGDPG